MNVWRRLRRLWPQKLLTQMILLILLALIVAQGVSTWLLSRAYQDHIRVSSERHLARQFSAVIQLLEQTPAELHNRVLQVWKRRGDHFHVAAQLPAVLADRSQAISAQEQNLKNIILTELGPTYQGQLYVRIKPAGKRDHQSASLPIRRLQVAIQQDSGQWLIFRTKAPKFKAIASVRALSFVLIASVLVLLVVVFYMRKITRPLSALAQAANDLGRGQLVAPLQEAGPVDVRETVLAFNRMNDRLQRFVSERTRLLAALSHDLRTPLTSMRLRLELMAAGEERNKLLASLDEIQQMTEATLSFVRQSGDVEETRNVDIGALVESLCEDLQDLNLAVDCPELDSVVMPLRPVSIRRALRNLIENAVNYGQSAQVGLLLEGKQVVITISDCGPGIPTTEAESVFEPFVRLEGSRNRNTGGTGLGLSIARQIIRSHGGDVLLENQHSQSGVSGLRVSVLLPR